MVKSTSYTGIGTEHRPAATIYIENQAGRNEKMNSWTEGPRFRFLGHRRRASGISVGKGAADVSFLLAEGRITRARRSVATKTPSGGCLIPKILGGLHLS